MAARIAAEGTTADSGPSGFRSYSLGTGWKYRINAMCGHDPYDDTLAPRILESCIQTNGREYELETNLNYSRVKFSRMLHDREYREI